MNLIRGFRKIPDFRRYTLFEEEKPLGEELTDTSQLATGLTIGTVFYTDVSGWVVGARYYRGTTGWTGNRYAHLWDLQGTALVGIEFASPISSAWNEVLFNTPIFILANNPYAISSSSDAGLVGYVYAGAYFSAVAKHVSPLHAYRDADAAALPGLFAGNGVFTYLAKTFPISAFNGTNYFVDVLFIPAT